MVQCVGNRRIAKGELAVQETSLLDGLRHAETRLWSLAVFPLVCSHNAMGPANREIRPLRQRGHPADSVSLASLGGSS